MSEISKAAHDLIVREEISSRALYEKKYRAPTWPAFASGVTIGVGYDCGYVTPPQLRADWSGLIPAAMIEALVPCCGVTGNRAQAMARALRGKVDIPYDAAMIVHDRVIVPRYLTLARRALPNFDALPPDCRGALVSLVFNRGASFTKAGERYREMRAIRAHMAASRFDAIAAEIRAMKRLWPSNSGLPGRREREARLFERGLATLIRPAISDNATHDMTEWEMRGLQERLSALGFYCGAIDGQAQEAVAGALAAFQRYHNLPVTGLYDDLTRDAMRDASPRVVADARANASVGDLRDKGSQTIAAADGLSGPAKWLALIGFGKAGEDAGALDRVRDMIGEAGVLRDLFEQAAGLVSWGLRYWWIVAVIAAVLIWRNRKRIVAARLADHRSARNMGR